MAYERVATVKIARPDTEEGFMIINASDYRADLHHSMYEQGLAYDPAVWKPYVEQPLKAVHPEAIEPEPHEPELPAGRRVSIKPPEDPKATEKK
jgi:hypothetical protein